VLGGLSVPMPKIDVSSIRAAPLTPRRTVEVPKPGA